MQQWPNFFLIGAPKCGTTALSYYLNQHPDLLFSQPKEPNFFDDEWNYPARTYSWEAYSLCFVHGTGREVTAGEGSTNYLFSRQAVPNILRWMPEARFIVLLRDPVETSYAMYWEQLYNGLETIEDFETAWRAQPARSEGRWIPSSAKDAQDLLQYGARCSYSEQLERLFNHVARERVLILLYDDIKKDADAVYQQALEFLGLRSFHLPTYERINPSKQPRWPALQPILRRGLQLAGKAKRAMGWKKALGLATRITTKHEKRPPLDPTFRAELAAYFREDVARTGELIGRDLSGWAKG